MITLLLVLLLIPSATGLCPIGTTEIAVCEPDPAQGDPLAHCKEEYDNPTHHSLFVLGYEQESGYVDGVYWALNTSPRIRVTDVFVEGESALLTHYDYGLSAYQWPQIYTAEHKGREEITRVTWCGVYRAHLPLFN